MRALKFSRYLPRFGWTPSVLTADPSCYPADLLDPELEEEARGIEVRRIFYPGAWRILNRKAPPQPPAALSAAVRKGPGLRARLRNFALATEELPWALRAIVALRASDTRPDAIVTMSPPGWAHLIGDYARRRLRVPWVMDFRDRWSGSPAHPPPAPWRQIEARAESRFLATADRVLVATPALEAHYRRLRPEARISTITNGYDAEDFANLRPSPAETFTVSHVGTLGGSRSPEPFLRAWRAFLVEGQIDLESVACRFVGPTSRIDFEAALASDPPLRDSVTFRPFCSHRAALQEMVDASVLLLLLPDQVEAGELLTGKAFEYMAAGRPILALAPEGALADLLRANGAAAVVAPGDQAGLVAALRRLHERHRAGDMASTPVTLPDPGFERSRLTERLARILDELILPARSRDAVED